MEAVVLAGGFGTRLQKVISDVPKPMASINDKPFLEYLLNYLGENGITRVILSVGFKHEMISDHFKKAFNSIDIDYSIEDEPLGTGGGISRAVSHIRGENFYVINGDTLFEIDLKHLYDESIRNKSDVSIALKILKENRRYGSVSIDGNNRITGFLEKSSSGFNSYINGGIYLINKARFGTIDLPVKYSFEKDFLERYFDSMNLYGFPFDNYFLDIGIPKDFELAQTEFKKLGY